MTWGERLQLAVMVVTLLALAVALAWMAAEGYRAWELFGRAKGRH